MGVCVLLKEFCENSLISMGRTVCKHQGMFCRSSVPSQRGETRWLSTMPEMIEDFFLLSSPSYFVSPPPPKSKKNKNKIQACEEHLHGFQLVFLTLNTAVTAVSDKSLLPLLQFSLSSDIVSKHICVAIQAFCVFYFFFLFAFVPPPRPSA